MNCKQLGGVCDKEFCANTFEEIVQKVKMHGMDMYMIGDQAHMEVINKMKNLMNDSKAMDEWMKSKKKQFDALPEDK